MTIWTINVNWDSAPIEFAEKAVIKKLVRSAFSPEGVRSALSEGLGEVRLVAEDRIRSRKFSNISDFMVWGWIPFFSSRARSAAIGLGLSEGDFWKLQIVTEQGKVDSYVFSPTKDVELLEMGVNFPIDRLPGDEPSFSFLMKEESVDLYYQEKDLPAMFRILRSSPREVFPETFCNSDFRLGWTNLGLMGASFQLFYE